MLVVVVVVVCLFICLFLFIFCNNTEGETDQ